MTSPPSRPGPTPASRLLAGDRNLCFLPESQARTFEYLSEPPQAALFASRRAAVRAPRRLPGAGRAARHVPDHSRGPRRGRLKTAMAIPRRLELQAGRFALVDGIPFALPVNCERSPALFAVFPIDAEGARALLPGSEIHPLRLWKKGTARRQRHRLSRDGHRQVHRVQHRDRLHAWTAAGASAAARRCLRKRFGTGQFVVDLPVSTEISVKGGKGIWGMPKHQANLDYRDRRADREQPVRPRRPALRAESRSTGPPRRDCRSPPPRRTTASSAAC